MNPALHLRCLTRTDLPFADSVRALEGWNQTTHDWERFLAMEPAGCFVAEWQGTPAGTATTTVYGAELGWIGMVLVHPGFRRRGIGHALLRRCIEYLQSGGVRCIKLDATPAGKAVYHGMGFQEEWTLTRWERRPDHRRPRPRNQGLRELRDADRSAIAKLDDVAFGVGRPRLLQLLTAQSRNALVLESEPGVVAGCGMIREGTRALYLGPVVACSAHAALPIIAALLRNCDGDAIFWDIPDRQHAAATWAEENGFNPQRSLTRMFLGENTTPGDPEKVFAIAGPEIG